MPSDEKPSSASTHEHNKGFAIVKTNASISLTVSTFLASICLATFAVFLPNAIHISGIDLGAALILSSETLLGVASVFFLIVATVMSIVLTNFGLVPYPVRKSLNKGKSIPLTHDEVKTLNNIFDLYKHAVFVMYGGILAVLISLPLLGFHINNLIGVAIVLAYISLGIYFRNLINFTISHTFP